MPIKDELRLPNPPPGRYGIEIETEVPDISDYPDGFLELNDEENQEEGYVLHSHLLAKWDGHYDGSLRGCGVEYVLKQPLDLPDAIDALTDFKNATQGIDFLKDSVSTSVHVHVNFAHESVETLANFLSLWILFENILVEFSGETRRSNLFALPARCSMGVLRTIKTLLKIFEEGSLSYVTNIHESLSKYGAINVTPLARWGSVEIRSLRGTTDVDLIKSWLDILDCLVEFSRSNPRSYVLHHLEKDEIDLFYKVFGRGERAEMLLAALPDREALPRYLSKNLYMAAEILTFISDYEKAEASVSSKTPKKKTWVPVGSAASEEVLL